MIAFRKQAHVAADDIFAVYINEKADRIQE